MWDWRKKGVAFSTPTSPAQSARAVVTDDLSDRGRSIPSAPNTRYHRARKAAILYAVTVVGIGQEWATVANRGVCLIALRDLHGTVILIGQEDHSKLRVSTENALKRLQWTQIRTDTSHRVFR